MNRKSICFASILKPLDDPRTFYKFAQTIGQTNKYLINIIGFEAKNISKEENIHFYPLKNIKRNFFSRLVSALKCYKIWIKVKAQLVVVSSPDLLPLSLLYKILFGAKIYYDVQENYWKNILFQRHYHWLIKLPLALYVKSWELISWCFIEKYFLAEAIYLHQMPFLAKKAMVLENRFVDINNNEKQNIHSKKQRYLYLYSGTVSREHGTDLCIKLFKSLLELKKDKELVICGLCRDISFLLELQSLAEGSPYIHLYADTDPIPYLQLRSLMEQADYGMISYRDNGSFEGKIPTKYYEYVALNIPMLIHIDSMQLPSEQSLNSIRIDFNTRVNKKTYILIEALKFKRHQQQNGIYWVDYEADLLKVFN